LREVNLPALLAQVLKELETSTDPDRVALLRQLREGTHTPRGYQRYR